MPEIALIIGMIFLGLVAFILIKLIKPRINNVHFDKSTELLLRLDDIKRNTNKKSEKLIKLSKLELDIESHLNEVRQESQEKTSLDSKLFS